MSYLDEEKAAEEFALLMADIIVDYTNYLIEDDEPGEPIPPIWPKIQRYFAEGYDLILEDRPCDNSEIEIRVRR